MRKVDVERSYHNGSSGEPMLNIKVYGSPSDKLAQRVETDSGMDGFAAWFASRDDDSGEDFQPWWESACELGLEEATELAGEVFGEWYGHLSHSDRRVWQAGRSGGWLYVTGLSDVDDWDAVALGRWARFAKGVAALVDDVPYQALSLMAFNAYAWECETFAAAERAAEDIAADAMADLLASH